MTRTISIDHDAAVGTAIRAVIDLLPQYGQVVVRLDADQRRAVVDTQLTEIADREIVPKARVDELRSLLAGKGDDPGLQRKGSQRQLRPLDVADILRAAALAPVSDSGFLDTLWDAAVTMFGVLAGESIA